jgi:hypothetical protein
LGGGNALAAAADDGRVAAAISQVPFLDMSQAYTPDPRVSEEMEAAAAAGRYLPAVGQPHEAAFINAPGAEVGWRRLVAIGEDSRWRNRCSAAWLVKSPYSVSQHAATLRCPWLVCVAANDQVAKPGPAIEAARRAPKGVIRQNLVSDFRGVEFKPIDVHIDAHKRSVSIPDILAFEIEGVLSRNRSGEPLYIDNTGHPASRRLALARAKETRVTSFGLGLELVGKGNNGHYAPFAWAA